MVGVENLLPRLEVVVNSLGLENMPQESKWPAMLTKAAKPIFIFSWMGSSGGKTSWMTASRQGRKCFVSAAFASKTGKFLCGLLGSQIIDNLNFVNLEAT